MATDSGLEILKIVQNTARAEAAKSASSLEFGVVRIFTDKSIEIELPDGNVISGNNLMLSDRCLPRTIKIPYDDDASHLHKIDAKTEIAKLDGLKSSGPNAIAGPVDVVVAGDTGHTHDIKINTKPALSQIKLWRGLIVGDVVIMLRMSNGMYFVLERASFKGDECGEAANKIYNKKDKEAEKDEDNPDKE